MRGFIPISKEQANTDGVDLNVVKLPKRATKGSAGYDIYANKEFILYPHQDIKIPTGLRAAMNKGEVLVIVPRSGLGFKYYCRLANTLGIIDEDYFYADNEGHIWVKVRNEGDRPMTVKAGEAFCQAIFLPFLITDDDSFDEGEERHGGFGSTSR